MGRRNQTGAGRMWWRALSRVLPAGILLLTAPTAAHARSHRAAGITAATGPITAAPYRPGKCVIPLAEASVNGTAAVIGTCDEQADQVWTLEASGQLQIGGKCLDITREQKVSGTKVQLWTCKPATGEADRNQVWVAQPGGQLVNPYTAKCLDVPAYNYGDGTRLQMSTCNPGNPKNQRFTLPMPGVAYVPCNSSTLAADIGSAAPGQTLSLASDCVYVLTASLPAVSQDLTILGDGATLERSSAPATPPFTIVEVTGSATLTISSLNFRNGDNAITVGDSAAVSITGGTFSDNDSSGDGGAIFEDSALTDGLGLQVRDAHFIDNTAHGSGGAIANESPVTGVEVSDSDFTANTASGDGGAIYDYGFLNNGVNASGTFTGNVAGGSGGVAYDLSNNGGDLSGVFDGNRAGGDGGVASLSPNGPGDVSGDFSANTAGGNGGVAAGCAAVSGQAIDNHADGAGGAVYIGADNACSFLPVNGTFRGNTAADGGAVANSGVVLLDGDFTGNRASGDGGGIYNLAYGDIELDDPNISGNAAGALGGGIYDAGRVAGSSQITGNKARSGGGIYAESGPGFFAQLTSSSVIDNKPDNCEPTGSIAGCSN
jgi:hypothetical protein